MSRSIGRVDSCPPTARDVSPEVQRVAHNAETRYGNLRDASQPLRPHGDALQRGMRTTYTSVAACPLLDTLSGPHVLSFETPIAAHLPSEALSEALN
jgi:hypothetical protein